jgi:hypothetical protein
MVDPLREAGVWTLAVFTDDPGVVSSLEDLVDRRPQVRAVAVVPGALPAPAAVLVLVDEGERLASALGFRNGTSVMLDARGTVTQRWSGLPEVEAVDLYARRPAYPSAVPPWLFPVLAAAVLAVFGASWIWTRQPAVPAAPAAVALSAPATTAASAPAAEVDEAGAETPAAADVEDGAEEPSSGPGKPANKGRRAPNQIAGWVIAPRPKAATIAREEGGGLTLAALPDERVTACRAAVPLSGPLTFSAEWKLTGFTDKPVRAAVRMLDADEKLVKGPTGRAVLGRGRGTADWKAISAEVTPPAGATQARLCLDLDPGVGSVSIRNVVP